MPLVDVINSLHSEDALIWLLTFQDHSGGNVLRACNNNEPMTSRGMTFEAFPFSVKLPPDSGDGRPQNLTITFPNTGRELMRLLREYAPESPPQVKLELVLASAPSTVEKVIDFLQVSGADYDALAVNVQLTATPIFGRKTLMNLYDDDEFPGLHWSLR